MAGVRACVPPMLALLLAPVLWLPRAAGAAPPPIPVVPANGELLLIDPVTTRVEFSLRLLVVRKLDGRFPLVEGTVVLDRDRNSADIAVDIDAREVMMERAEHAEWARSPEFFDAARHPAIRFSARGVPLELFRDGGDLAGALTLRGLTRPATLELLPSDCEEPGLGCPVRAEGELSRSDFDMTARRFVLSDKVRLSFTIRVLPLQEATAEPPTGPLP